MINRRPFSLLVLIAIAVSSCGDDDTTESADTTTTITRAESSTTTESSTTAVAESTTTAPVAETTTVAPETTSTVAEPTGISVEDLTLDGVDLGTEAESAIADLLDRFGAPTADNGWEEGCPFDGPGLNERVLQWGGLNAYFTRPDEATAGVFQAWWYRVNLQTGEAIPGGPGPDEIDLPGEVRFGDPISELEVQLGLPTTFDDVFQLVYVNTESYTISTAELDIAAPIVSVGVPFVPACE